MRTQGDAGAIPSMKEAFDRRYAEIFLSQAVYEPTDPGLTNCYRRRGSAAAGTTHSPLRSVKPRTDSSPCHVENLFLASVIGMSSASGWQFTANASICDR